MRSKKIIIAVDFDGTLCEHQFPDIGKPNDELIDFLIKKKSKGVHIILWTCREGLYLKKAVEWCEDQGLYFDKVNENVDGISKGFANHKIIADIYIDGRSINPNDDYCLEMLKRLTSG